MVVNQYVETVADGYAQDYRTDSQRHQGHISLYPIHTGEGEERSVKHGAHHLEYESALAEAEQQENHYDYQRDAYGQHHIALDGACVGDAAQRVAVGQHLHEGMLLLERLARLLQQMVEPGRLARFHLGEAGREEGHHNALVGTEEVAVLDGVVADGGLFFGGHKLGHQSVAPSQRVDADDLYGIARHILLQHLPVLLHLPVDGLRGAEGVEFLIERVVYEGGQMAESVVHRAERGLHLEGAENAADVLEFGVAVEQRLGEFVHTGG